MTGVQTCALPILYDRMVGGQRAFSPLTGIGGSGISFTGTIASFTQRIVEFQGAQAEAATRLDEGQQIATRSVEARFTETSGVSVDQEMANLVELQNAYAANARVISSVKELMDLLMRI